MKRLFVFFCLLSFSITAFAQQHHYLFLQSEAQQAFYVRYDGRIIVSGTAGYIILSKLKESEVKFGLGFSTGNQTELNFELSTNRQDKGYLIKQFGEKGWGLFDLQTGDVQYAIAPEVKSNGSSASSAETIISAPASDPFAEMLSQVTKDSTVKQVAVVKPLAPKPIVNQEQPRAATIPEVAAAIPPKAEANPKTELPAQTAIPSKPEAITTAKVEPPVVVAPVWTAPAKSIPEIISIVQSNEGVDLVVADKAGTLVDTIKIFIPQLKQVVVSDTIIQSDVQTDSANVLPLTDTLSNAKKLVVDTQVVQQAEVPIIEAEQKAKGQLPVLDSVAKSIPDLKTDTISSSAPLVSDSVAVIAAKTDTSAVAKPMPEVPNSPVASSTDTVIVAKPAIADSSVVVSELQQESKALPTPVSKPNTNCRATATNEDFIQLRKKMVLAKNEAMMVEAAKKGFAVKCYTLAQLQLLSSLFLTDEWRYRFYDAALPSVTDFAGFESLERNITDPYYRKRFSALLPAQ